MKLNRSKTVSFRLSREEYDVYREACANVGVRNVSELAREAMDQMVGRNHNNSDRAGQINYLRDRLRMLSREIERLSETIERLDANREPVRHEVAAL